MAGAVRMATQRRARNAPVMVDAIGIQIERDAFAAWPAAECVGRGPWRLRFTDGVTRRANSVWPYGGAPEEPLDEAIGAVREAYARRGLPAVFQLSRELGCASLDDRLDALGWASEAPVAVRTATPDAAGSAATDGVTVSPAPSEDWFAFSGPGGRFRGEAASVYRALLERITAPCAFAERRVDDRIVAVGLGVAGATGVGVFGMRTDEAHRRAGHGQAILAGIAAWSRARGAARLYLQVEDDNAPALALYERSGFATRYRYHYRREPAPR